MQQSAIYFDNSVILSMLFAEPSAEIALKIWNKQEYRLSSILLQFECLTAVHKISLSLPELLRKEALQAHKS